MREDYLAGGILGLGAATVGVDSPLVLVAHGDACRVLPAIGRNVPNEVIGLMFVDGCLPPEVGPGLLASERFLERVRALVRDGADPRSSWFRHEVPVGTASVTVTDPDAVPPLLTTDSP